MFMGVIQIYKQHIRRNYGAYFLKKMSAANLAAIDFNNTN